MIFWDLLKCFISKRMWKCHTVRLLLLESPFLANFSLFRGLNSNASYSLIWAMKATKGPVSKPRPFLYAVEKVMAITFCEYPSAACLGDPLLQKTTPVPLSGTYQSSSPAKWSHFSHQSSWRSTEVPDWSKEALRKCTLALWWCGLHWGAPLSWHCAT